MKKALLVPEPSRYNPNTKETQNSPPKFSFGGQEQRPKTTGSSLNVPGPGHYKSKTLVGTESQGKTLGARFKIRHEEPGANLVPGPGAYACDFSPVRKEAPKWRVGTSQRDVRETIMRRTCDFPPANTYNPNYKFSKHTNASWGFGSNER